ncbi:PAS domain S-box protein [archaeon]|nr:PAS domain S-box protein [archaeon]
MKLDKNTILKEILPALIAENAQVIIYRMSIKDGKYQYISPSSIKIFGHSPKEFYDKPKIIQNIIAPKWKNYFKEKWNDLKKGIMPPTYEYQIIHGKTGELRWLNQRNVLKKDDNGNPIAIEGIVTDITKRKNIENTLYKSEENYKKYIENAPDGIFIVNEKGKYIDANPSACKMVGYSKEELLNLSIGDIKGEKNSKSSKQFFDLMKDGKISNNLNLKKKDGSIIYVALDAIKLSKNKYMAFCKDISKIKNTQIQLKRSEEKFKTIIKNSHPIIFMIDQQGKFLLSEGQMLSTLGLKPGQVVGTSALEMYKDFPDVIKGIKDALNGKTSDGIVKIKVGDKKIYFDIFFSPFKESPDKISACMGMAIDITEKINSMNALKESEERFSNFSRATFEAIVFSEKGVIIDANKQLADMFGSSSSELVGKNIMDFVAQESKDLVLQNIQYSIEKPYEHLAKKKNGTLFPIEVHGKTIYIGKQKIRVTIAVKVKVIVIMRMIMIVKRI